jgi:cytochrome c-type biogenesis protein CcmH/NrfG
MTNRFKNIGFAIMIASLMITGQLSVMANNDGAISSASQVHLIEGRDLLNMGQVDQSITSLSLALSHNPNLVEAHVLLGNAYSLKEQYSLAIQSYENALKIEANNVDALKHLAAAVFMTGDYNSTTEILTRLLNFSPNNFEALALLGLAQCKLGQYDNASNTFARAEGQFAGALTMAAELENTGKYVEAIKYYEAAHQLNPGSEVVSQGLAKLHKLIGQQ